MIANDKGHLDDVMFRYICKQISKYQSKGKKDLGKTMILYKKAKRASQGAERDDLTLLIELYENFTPALENERTLVDVMKQSYALYASDKFYSEIEDEIAVNDAAIQELALKRLELMQERQALAAKF